MRALGTWVMLAVWLVASSAWAQGSDVVMLANGGRLRGTVEVYEPGADVVIVLSDGTRRTVPAADVAQVIFGDAPPAPELPPATISPVLPGTPPTVLTPLTPPATPPAVITPLPPPAVITPSTPPPAYTPPAYSGESEGLPGVQHLGAVASIAGVPEGTPRTYAVDEELSPWAPDPATVELPVGPLHFGVELRGGVLVTLVTPFAYGGSYLGGATSPVDGGGEVSGVIDYRVVPHFHLRAAAVLGVRTGDDSSFSSPTYAWAFGTGMGTLGVRFMLGFDLARLFVLRIGGELAGDYLPTFRRIEWYGGPEFDLLGQLTDAGNLELGIAVSVPWSSACTIESDLGNPTGDFRCGDALSARLQALAGWVF